MPSVHVDSGDDRLFTGLRVAVHHQHRPIVGAELVGNLAEGDYFGEISVIDGGPRTATVVADEEVTLLELAAADFDSILSVPYTARVVMRNLAHLIREAEG